MVYVIPVAQVANYLAVGHRVKHHYLLGEPQNEIEVADVGPRRFGCQQYAAWYTLYVFTQSDAVGAHLQQAVGGYP